MRLGKGIIAYECTLIYPTQKLDSCKFVSKIAYDDILEAKEWNFPSLNEETRLPPPQGFSQI